MEDSIKSDALYRREPRLPAKIEELERTIKNRRTINDHVEDVFLDLYNKDTRFRAFLDATSDPESVEGSLSADNFSAATIIRDSARKISADHPLAKKNLASINLALKVVTRRWGIARNQTPNKAGNQSTENGE